MRIVELWGVFRKVERLLELEALHGEALKELKAGFLSLDRRLSRLEDREDLMVGEAKAAARAASSEATQGVVADLARRIGMLEARGPAGRTGRDRPRLT